MEFAIAQEKDLKRKDLLERYRIKLEQRQKEGEEAFIRLLFPTDEKECIHKKEFLDLIARKNPNLLTSYGFRQFILESSTEIEDE